MYWLQKLHCECRIVFLSYFIWVFKIIHIWLRKVIDLARFSPVFRVLKCLMELAILADFFQSISVSFVRLFSFFDNFDFDFVILTPDRQEFRSCIQLSPMVMQPTPLRLWCLEVLEDFVLSSWGRENFLFIAVDSSIILVD